MKLSFGALFSSSKKSSKKKKISSLGSNVTTTTAASSSSSKDSVTFSHSSIQRSITPKSLRSTSNKSLLGRDEYCWSSPSDCSAAAALPLSVSELFDIFDRDGEGKITMTELATVLGRLGPHPPTEEQLAEMVAEVDRDGDGCVTLEEFEAVWTALGQPAEAELREAFQVFDADGDGRISAEELMGVFAELGDAACSLEECRRMISRVDTGGDGFVCFEDFARMMDGR